MRIPAQREPYAEPYHRRRARAPRLRLGTCLATLWLTLAGTAVAQSAQTTTQPAPPANPAPQIAPASPSAAGQAGPMTAVTVDLPRYVGLWYQVALYPNKFQAQCARDTTATYRALPDGSLEVTNACRMANGELTQVVGQARFQNANPLPDSARAAKLEVRFAPKWLAWLPLVWGDYWVIDVASDYRYAVVSEPNRQFLWVLSRSPVLSEADDANIRRFLQAQGFDLARLQAHSHGSASK
jgi:apolipoprotein D and lipocalin family protein